MATSTSRKSGKPSISFPTILSSSSYPKTHQQHKAREVSQYVPQHDAAGADKKHSALVPSLLLVPGKCKVVFIHRLVLSTAPQAVSFFCKHSKINSEKLLIIRSISSSDLPTYAASSILQIHPSKSIVSTINLHHLYPLIHLYETLVVLVAFSFLVNFFLLSYNLSTGSRQSQVQKKGANNNGNA